MKSPRITKHLAIALSATVALLIAAPFADAQVIRLEKTAVVEPGQDVRLGNIATIQNTDPRTASTLASTIILPGMQSPHKIAADSILMAIVAQLGPAASNTLQMSGSESCDVTFTPAPVPTPAVMPIVTEIIPQQPATPPVATIPAAAAGPLSPSVITASITSTISPTPAKGHTLADLITSELATSLNLPTDQFRVEFDTENPLLDQAPPAGATWQCRPLTRTFLGTVPFSCEWVQGTHVTKRLTIQAHVDKKSRVLIAAKQIKMGDIITADVFQVQDLWLDQNLPTLFTKDAGSDQAEIIGLEAKRDLSVGSQLDQRDFKPADMARQGDILTVFFLSGSLKVQMNARALNNGKMHDQISVKNENTEQTYNAVLIGKNLAVVGGNLTNDQEKKLREMR